MQNKKRPEIDPNTKEGQEELERRLLKRKKELDRLAELAKQNPDEEPTGKLAGPTNEMDYHRDLKNLEKGKDD